MTATSETLVTPDETAPPVPTGRKRKLLPLIAFLVVVILGLGLWLAYRPVPDQLQGMVEARELRITSKVSARITAFHVEEGQPVKTGQLLYTLDSPEVEARSEQAGGALAAAQANADKADEGARPEDIRAAEAQWRRAQAAADLAQTTYQRTERLFEQGVLAGQKRDESRANALASNEAARAAVSYTHLTLPTNREV